MSQSETSQTGMQTRLLTRIYTAASVILWCVLTQILVWPVAAIVSAMRDDPLLSYGVMTPAAVVSAVLAFLIYRFIFPIEYPKGV